MVRQAIDMYLETLAGYVQDDDKLVTYKWLSKELEVHVNVAKQILWEFWEQHKKQEQILATFMLMGCLSGGGMRVEVVKESDLSTAKQKYNKLMTEHVYSLQKALPDIELLAISGEGDLRHSAVKCKESTIRSNEELELLRWGTKLVDKIQVPATGKSNSMSKAPDKNNSTSLKAPEKANSTSKVPEKANSIVKAIEKANSIGKVTEKQPPSVSSTKPNTTEKKSANHKPDQKQRNAFSNFFGKAGNQQNKKSPPSDIKKAKDTSPTGSSANKSKDRSPKDASADESKEKSPKNIFSSKVKGSSPKKVKTPSPPKKQATSLKESFEKVNDATKNKKSPDSTKPSKAVAAKSKQTARGKKRQSTTNLDNANKRRKRIVVASDSSDESSDNADEEPEQPPSPPPPEPVRVMPPSPPRIKQEGGKRKVRKEVDKTFQDDDGYFVTQKEYVYESCSDVEEEVVETKPPKPQPQPQQKANTKQATLFNFFKKG